MDTRGSRQSHVIVDGNIATQFGVSEVTDGHQSPTLRDRRITFDALHLLRGRETATAKPLVIGMNLGVDDEAGRIAGVHNDVTRASRDINACDSGDLQRLRERASSV